MWVPGESIAGGDERGIPHAPDRADSQETPRSVSYTHLRAHETVLDLVCRLLLEKKTAKHKAKATHWNCSAAYARTIEKDSRIPHTNNTKM